MGLTAKERGVLLLSARESIMTLFSEIRVPTINYKHYPGLEMPGGAFVTLTKEGDLRGCIGYIESEDTLFNTVCEAARLAATEDPRFPPLDEMELPRILIEISALSKPQPIKDYEEIVIGKHGLLLDEDNARAVLLPQVAIEHGMNISAFLTALCQKGGMQGKEWMNTPLILKTFTAEVFGEQVHRNLTGEIR